jgi:hypothetical protein
MLHFVFTIVAFRICPVFRFVYFVLCIWFLILEETLYSEFWWKKYNIIEYSSTWHKINNRNESMCKLSLVH